MTQLRNVNVAPKVVQFFTPTAPFQLLSRSIKTGSRNGCHKPHDTLARIDVVVIYLPKVYRLTVTMINPISITAARCVAWREK